MTPRSLAISCILGGIIINPAHGQIIPDSTTGTSAPNSCQPTCQITGGILAGDNLFHSFQNFSIQPGSSAYFSDPGVANIFSRVTGNNPSEIFGVLGVSGSANLFFLNPHGIVFGEVASLDINGSFLATTADAIQFGDLGSFNAVPESLEALPLLTVNPDALFFNQQNPEGAIAVNASSLSLNPGSSLTLVGQESHDASGVSLSSGNLTVPQGNIFLAAIQDGGRIELGDQGKPSLSSNVIPGNITISDQSILNVNGNGGGQINIEGDQVALTSQSQLLSFSLGELDGASIDIQANTLNITDNSEIVTATTGSGASPDIKIYAEDAFNLIGNNIAAFQSFLVNSISGGDRSNNSSSVVYTFSLASGQTGDIDIATQNLSVANGAWILASTINDGVTGNINIHATEDLTIDGSGIILGSALNSSGSVGQLSLNSNNLLMTNGGVISSSTLGSGAGGHINLDILDSINLEASLPNGFAPTGIYSNTLQGSGAAGELNINTSNLTLADGSQLSSSSGFLSSAGLIPIGGAGGNIAINVKDQINITGSSANDIFASGIVNNTFSNNSAGNISITTGSLNLDSQGTISASSIGSGDGGNIQILAHDSIRIFGAGFEETQNLYFQVISGQIEALNRVRGLLTYATSIGKAGDIDIQSPNLTLESGAVISTSAFNQGQGGDLNLDIGNFDVSSSTITSSALGAAESGDIKITANRLRSNGVIASASAGFGDSGDISITAADSVQLVGNEPSSLLAGGVFSNSSGFSNPGNLEINTKRLTVLDGNLINASNSLNSELQQPSQSIDINELNLASNLANNLNINAESIEIAGNSPNGIYQSSITTRTNAPFAASNIFINTSKLLVADQGEISVSSDGIGKAGNLKIVADSIWLNDQAILSGSTSSGTGGNIELLIQDLISIRNGSQIDTNARGLGNGGNITLDTTFLVTNGASSISANALSGQGGNIDIVATDIFKTLSTAITASSELGIDGEVNLTTFNTSDRNSIVKLPETTIQATETIVSSCGANSSSQGQFSYTGKSGLAASPLTEFHPSRLDFLADFGLSGIANHTEEIEPLAISQAKRLSITEATDWKVNRQGQVELTAPSANHFSAASFNQTKCPFG